MDGDGARDGLPPLRDVVAGASGWYPLAALGGLAATGAVVGHALIVLLPEIGRTLGVGPGAMAAILTGKALLGAVVALPLARLVQQRPFRALLAVGGAAVVAVLVALTAWVVRPGELAVTMLAIGAVGAVVAVAHQPLVAESYPPGGRVRALAVLAGARGVGEVTAPLLVGGLVLVVGLTWRGVFLVAGGLVALAAAAAMRLRDPGFGRWERAGPAAAAMEDLDDLALGDAVARLQAVPTLRRLFTFQAFLGAMLLPFTVFLVLFLEERWNLGPWGRGVVLSTLGLAAVVAVTLFGPVGERRFHRDPAGLVTLTARLWAMAVVLLVVAVLAPALVVVVAALAAAVGLVAAVGPGLATLHLSLVPPRLRSMSTALAAAWFAGVGGPVGVVLFGAADRRYGLAGALVLTTTPGFLAALVLHAARHTVAPDLRRLDAEVGERRPLRPGSTGAAPALAVHGLVAGHDGPPVVHDVDLQLAPGERVALLGANGAGKTTLLHALAGLLAVRAGVVRVRGRDVTHHRADRHPERGLVLVEGPSTLFDPLTVDEHLRLFATRAGSSPSTARHTTEAVWRRFPALAARRRVRARDLSGGERRMLGLARALLVRPDVLLVDELTLGLADVVRDGVVDMAHAIADGGTAVLLVDQSLEVARRAAERAVVLADGTIAYDGPLATLDDHRLPAVYLGGRGRP